MSGYYVLKTCVGRGRSEKAWGRELLGVFEDGQLVCSSLEKFRPLWSIAHSPWILTSFPWPVSGGMTVLVSVDWVEMGSDYCSKVDTGGGSIRSWLFQSVCLFQCPAPVVCGSQEHQVARSFPGTFLDDFVADCLQWDTSHE